MNKPNRSIFQPNLITDFFLKEYSKHTHGTIGDIVNSAIYHYFTPQIHAFSSITEPLLMRIEKGDEISQDELQDALSRAVTALSKNPIGRCDTLEQIMYYFRANVAKALRFDYALIIAPGTDADIKLRHLNEILKTVDRDFTLGMHELGERTSTVFENWDKLCMYPEIYTDLGLIIKHEKMYMSLDPYLTIEYIKQLENDVVNSPIDICSDEFPTNISLADKVQGLKFEILVYYSDNGYSYLSGDYGFEHMSPEIREYYSDLNKTIRDARDSDIKNLEEYYEDLQRLEQKGRSLFTDLAKYNDEITGYEA